MADINDKWVGQQRRRWMRPNAHLYIRPDAYRFMAPGAPRLLGKDAVGYFWPQEQHNAADQRRDESHLEPEAERELLLKLKGELAALKADIRFERLLRALKAYNPDQPRVPAGNSDGGRWTSDGNAAGERRIRLAGETPTNEPPEIPKERPPTSQERTSVVKEVARQLGRFGGPIGKIIGAAYWLYEYDAEITASLDPPKSLEELHQAVATPKLGYQRHHIVEQTSAEQDGFHRSMIDAPDNLVRIPTLQHRDISAWFQTKTKEFGYLSPREYLRGKSWDERRKVGLDALIEQGVLKP